MKNIDLSLYLVTGEAESDEASGIYVGGLTGGNIYSPAELVVEGGDIFNINGGPLVASSVKANNIIYINIKGGKADFIFGGAALSTTYGNRIISVTGGQIDYSVFGGSNGTAGGNGDGTLDGDSFIYIGGNDSMDTVESLSDYALANKKKQNFRGNEC